MRALFLLLLIALPASATARPASLNIVSDCFAIPNDSIDDTQAIRDCVNQIPHTLVIPTGVFEVNATTGSEAAAITVATSDTTIAGLGPASRIKLIRPSTGFNSSRVFMVSATTEDTERITFRDFTIDGGRTPWTCFEAKHTPGVPPDGKGQQQHGIFVRGQGAFVREVAIERMNFVGLSGDALYLYQDVEDVRLTGQTVGGWCRAGIAVNAYTHCDNDPTQGMRRITIARNTFLADATASEGARGIDVEPNAPVCDVLIADNVTDEIEIGQSIRMRIEGNTITTVGNQSGGSIAVVSATNLAIRNNIVLGADVVTPPIYVRKSHIVNVEGNTIKQPYPTEGIGVSNNGSSPSSDVTIANNRVEYVGPDVANAYAIRTQGIEGALTIERNTTVGEWNYFAHIFGATDVLVAGNLWGVGLTGVVVRSQSAGILKTGVVTLDGNRGTAAKVFLLNDAIDAFRDCNNTSTGTRSPGVNVPQSCSPSVTALEARVDAYHP